MAGKSQLNDLRKLEKRLRGNIDVRLNDSNYKCEIKFYKKEGYLFVGEEKNHYKVIKIDPYFGRNGIWAVPEGTDLEGDKYMYVIFNSNSPRDVLAAKCHDDSLSNGLLFRLSLRERPPRKARG